MEPIGQYVARAQDDACLRQQVRSALEARSSSEFTSEGLCAECRPPKGLLRVSAEGRYFMLTCPQRDNRDLCRLARNDAALRRTERARWLDAHGVGARYQGMDLSRVDEAARITVGGYLDRLGDHVRAGKGLLISGPTGTGKTAILGLIAERAHGIMLQGGCWMVYSYDLYAAICRRDEAARERLETWRNCRLLLLDEFGAAYGADFPASEFEGMMEHRQADQLATCVTTNLSLADLRRSPEWSRVYDRWRSTCWGIELVGASKREALEGMP
jgi:DNA replication protein DnaC